MVFQLVPSRSSPKLLQNKDCRHGLTGGLTTWGMTRPFALNIPSEVYTCLPNNLYSSDRFK